MSDFSMDRKKAVDEITIESKQKSRIFRVRRSMSGVFQISSRCEGVAFGETDIHCYSTDEVLNLINLLNKLIDECNDV